MSDHFKFLIALLFALTIAVVAACGDDECENDHQCEDGEVCEPAGCREACEGDTDCRAGYECAPRHVEDGGICLPRDEFR